jgi:hypothetical protein
MLCELAESARSKSLVLGREAGGLVVGSAVFVMGVFLSSGYWFILLPWAALMAMIIAISMGWCFGLMELAAIL